MSAALPRSLPRASTSATCCSRSIRRSLSTAPTVPKLAAFKREPLPRHQPVASSSQLDHRPPPPHLDSSLSPPATPPSNQASLPIPPPDARYVPLDIQDFLRGYPLFQKNRWHVLNALFYKNEQLATPSEWTIEDLLSRMRRAPKAFVDDHAAFEWLFPIPELSGNIECWKLEPHEVQEISSSPLKMNRLIRAYDHALRVYGIVLVDRESGLLRASADFKTDALPLLTDPSHPLRLTRLLKSLTCLSPPPPSPLTVLHHIPSLILFLLAQHNAGRLDLSPNTPGGEALELRWGMCIRNKAFRESVGGLINSRRGTPGEEGKWGVKEYESWVVGRNEGREGTQPISVARAVRRGTAQRRKETKWLSDERTKREFLTPGEVLVRRRAASFSAGGDGGVYQSDILAQEEKEREQGEWEELVTYGADEGVGGEGGGEEQVWAEEGGELEEGEVAESVEGRVGRTLERGDEEDEEGWGGVGAETKKRE